MLSFKKSRRRRTFKIKTLLDYVFVVTLIITIIILLKTFGFDEFGGNARIIDGDSLVVESQSVRLYGIDAPEMAQTCQRANASTYNCGKQARRYLAKLVADQAVTCNQVNTDQYQRAVSICKVGDVELNLAMVKSGWALAFLEHSLNYAKAEARARKKKSGVWQGNFINPSEWRAERR